jgi:hypothetical protein
MTSMRLCDLEPAFIRREVRDGTVYHVTVGSISEADGVLFLCPVCWQRNNGPIGTHGILCWKPNAVPDDAQPGPGRWQMVGHSCQDLTLVAGSSSVHLTSEGGCKAHFYVRNGEIVPC